jgi:hypothetical protein
VTANRRWAAIAAELSDAAYTAPATWETGNAHAVLTVVEARPFLAFRGTDPKKLVDVLRDVEALAFDDPLLGKVHGGFYADVAQLAWRVAPALMRDGTAELIVTGHSKGGGEALLFTAMLAAIGLPPRRVITFGSPRVGGAQLASLLAAVPGEEYRHGADPVPLLPPGYEHPYPLIALAAAATVDPLADHAMAGYRAALAV